MSRSDLFQIGEVAKLFNISVGTLRHYEHSGLLKPEYIDSATGYRYYSHRQFEALNTIRYLRALDMPLDEIKDFLCNRDIDTIRSKLLQQKEAVAKKRRELEAIESKIDHRLQQLQEATNAKLGLIQVEDVPALRIARMRGQLVPRHYLDLEQPIRKLAEGQKDSVVFLGKVGLGISPEHLANGDFEQYDMIFLTLDHEDEYEGTVEYIPAGRCLTVRFCGGHADAPIYYKQMINQIEEEDLKICGFSREITIIDYGLTNDISKFVTEIRIPIE